MKLTAVTAAAIAILAGTASAARAPVTFVWPTAVDVEPSGTLLVVENGLRRLVRLDPATGRVTVLAMLTKPYDVQRAPSGSVYVTDGPKLRRMDGRRAPAVVAQAVGDIGRIAIARNGDVYFTTESAIWRLAGGKGAPVQVVPNARLSGPHGLAVARDGTLLVSDTGNHLIRRIDPASGRVTTFARLTTPGGMDVAADGTVYVTDGEAGRIVHLSAKGKRLGFVGRLFADPYDLDLAPGGAIYVVESLAVGDVRRVSRS